MLENIKLGSALGDVRGPLRVRWVYVYVLSHRYCPYEGELKCIYTIKRPRQKARPN